MKIKIYEDRSYSRENFSNEGTENENLATTLYFQFPETVNGVETSTLNKYIVFDINGEPNTDILTSNNSYSIPTAITQLGTVSFNIYLVAPTNNGEDSPFRWISKKITLNFNDANDMTEIVITVEEINIFNSLLSELNSAIANVELLEDDFEEFKEDYDELKDDFEEINRNYQAAISQVENVNIDAIKTGSTATVTITNRQGTEKTVEIQDGTDYVLTNEDKQEIINTVEAEVSLDIPTKVSQLENDSEFIDKEVNNLTNYTLKTSTGSSIELSINSTTYVMTLNLKNSAGTTISTGTVDLPLETMVVGATYDNTNKKIVLTLKNGSTIDVPVADLISGLQSEITSSNKLSSDLVDDTNHTNKFVTSTDKTNWNAKYDKPSGGIPKADLSEGVQASLGKADTAIQDVSGKEDKTNKTGTINSSSTTAQYPNAKAVYDNLVLRDEEISNLKTKNELLVKDHVPIENTGTEIQLTGTGDLPMELVPYGNISQETTSISEGDEYDSPSIEHESPVKVVDGEYGILIKNSDDTQSQTQTIDTLPNPLYSENDCYKYLTSEQATALGLNTGAGWYCYNEYYNQNFTSGVSSVTINDMKSNGQFYSTVGGTVSETTITFDGTTTGNGNIVYELATPTYTKITNTNLIASLEALKDMQSYYDITNISQTHGNNQADMRINAKAFMSEKTVYDELTNLEKESGHIYGIRRKITNNSSSSWERLLDSVGKVANATKNGETVTNDFDSLAPWSEIKTCNYDLTTKKIKAWFGDPNFKFNGTNGDVFTYIPKTYWKIYQENDYDYVLLAYYPKTGFKEIDDFFIGRYNGSVVSYDRLLHTYSGLVPTTNKTITQFRTLANALGTNFSQLDWRYFVLQMLYLVEYADYNSQNKLGNGIMNRIYLQTLVAESNTNRAIVSSSSGYYIGQTIRIGTSNGGTQVADARKITAIESYSENGVTGYALTFDGTAVNIAVGNYVCTMAQETGQCDSLGMKSGCLNNDGYHAVIYRGVENIFANIWQFVDGINIKDNIAYIGKDHSVYVSDKFEDPYKAVGYTNCATNGWIKTLGFDVNEPFFRFPTEVGGGSSNYMSDYYYQSTGYRVALVGGSLHFGANDGLWSWIFSSASSNADSYVGCRVLIDNQ